MDLFVIEYHAYLNQIKKALEYRHYEYGKHVAISLLSNLYVISNEDSHVKGGKLAVYSGSYDSLVDLLKEYVLHHPECIETPTSP